MSFFNASKKKEDVKQGGSNYITGSGVYPVAILAPVVSVSKGGSESVDLYVEHAGQKQIVYGNLRITNNDGSPNKIGAKIFNQLLIIADVDAVADPVSAELPIGKKDAMKEVDILEDLCETAEELVNGETPGAGYERELKYVNNITFKDGLDEATIAQWIADKRPKGTGSAGSSTPEKAPNFGTKRFGKSSDE
jgi:hypothetical protein